MKRIGGFHALKAPIWGAYPNAIKNQLEAQNGEHFACRELVLYGIRERAGVSNYSDLSSTSSEQVCSHNTFCQGGVIIF